MERLAKSRKKIARDCYEKTVNDRYWGKDHGRPLIGMMTRQWP